MGRGPETVCTEALALGEELLRRLREPSPAAADLDGTENLVAEREQLLNELQGALEAAPPPEGLLPSLGALLSQQQALEAGLRQQMNLLSQTMRNQQATRANVDSFRRAMNPGTRSRMLDQKR